jgi:hypothetical protein
MSMILIKIKGVGMMGVFRYLMIGVFSVAATQLFVFQAIYVYQAISDFVQNK